MSDLLFENKNHLIAFAVITVLFFTVMLPVVKVTLEMFMKQYLNLFPSSAIQNYFKFTGAKKWYFTSCIVGIVHALMILGLTLNAILKCDTPVDKGQL